MTGEDAARPWDDPDDPKPVMFDADGRWTREGVEWIKRSGKRRHAYMAPRMDLPREQFGRTGPTP